MADKASIFGVDLLSLAPPASPEPSLHGLQAWTYDPWLAGSSGQPSGGSLNLVAVPVPATITVSNIWTIISGGGAALTNCYMGLYTVSGSTLTLAATTADQSSDWTSSGVKSVPLIGAPITIPGGPGVKCYLGFLVNSTGSYPTFARLANFPLGAQTSLNGSGTLARGHTKSSVGNNPLPSSVTTSNGGFHISFWMGLS